MRMNLKERIIKYLGGYTEKEYTRLERKYEGLLDSKTNNDTAYIVNEHIYRVIKNLRYFAKSLFGVPSDEWAKIMYNVLNNNFFRVMIRYVHCRSTSIYSVDTTMINDNEFIKIIQEENKQDELDFILETD